MTISVRVHVNGQYRATVKHSSPTYGVRETVIEGAYPGSPNPSGEGHVQYDHGVPNTYDITEEYIGDKS